MEEQTTFYISFRLAFLLVLLLVFPSSGTSDFLSEFQASWNPSNVKLLDGGQQLQLVLDTASGSGFKSKDQYLFGRIDMQMKLVPHDSAGTVTAFYLSSQTTYHDELDFEFLGNVSGEPLILQTNVFASGVGGREQRIYLWFDPTADFHTYSVCWGNEQIIFLVDGTPIRVFRRTAGFPYLDKQPMAIYSSIWNGDTWATRGGLVKINWAHAPFIASYQNFHADACVASISPSSCTHSPTPCVLNYERLAWVKQNYMIYDYCTDRVRYPNPAPEC